jgi:DNA polymerase-3 subunit epsilon
MSDTGIFYFDLETGGVDPRRSAILQIAWIIERNGVVMDERVYDVCPENDAEMNFGALAVNNFTFDRIKAGKNLYYVLCSLKSNLQEHKFGASLFSVCGHNVRFDIDFLMPQTYKCNENLSTCINFHSILDTCAIARFLSYKGVITGLTSHKLTSLCEHFKIPLNAHDALSDIRATRTLFHILEGL